MTRVLMAGDLVPPAVGQILHMGTIYESVVVCPCGCEPTQFVTSLENGTRVQIDNLPYDICEVRGLPRSFQAVRVGDCNHPAFQVVHSTGHLGCTLSYEELFHAADSEHIQIQVVSV
ncbi:hypothetical protein KC851_01815 [Candidatus Kaiserbacteria bacterium]|nr:hypothetical protein [Candidatus Kaiserbacteria bacterium]